MRLAFFMLNDFYKMTAYKVRVITGYLGGFA